MKSSALILVVAAFGGATLLWLSPSPVREHSVPRAAQIPERLPMQPQPTESGTPPSPDPPFPAFAPDSRLLRTEGLSALNRGARRLAAGDWWAALAELETAHAALPWNARACVLLGLAYDELNLIDDLVLIRPCLEHAAAEGNGIGRRLIEGLDRSADIERRYTVVASNHFVASHPPGAAYEQVIGEILAALEAARADIEAPLGLATRRLVPVVIYDFGEFGAATAAPHWAAARYDGKIRIPVEVLDRSSASIAQVLTHEYAHALFHELADRRLPVWFNEGLASLLAGKRSRLDVLDRAAAEGNLLGVLDLSRSFARLPVAEAEIAYAQSLAIVSDLVDEVGWLGVRGLFLHLRARRSGGFEAAFATLSGEPPDSYLERWSATVSPAAVLPR